MPAKTTLADSDLDADPLRMDDLISNLSLAPTDDEELDAKRDLVSILWSHLSDEGKIHAWNELAEIRRKANEWSSDDVI